MVQAFKEIRLPIAISFGAVGGPGFLTNIVTTESGKESRNADWSLERGEWEISYDAREASVFDQLESFFRIVRGRYYGFRFRDWNDYQVDASNGMILPVGDSVTLFQLYKLYQFEDEVYYRRIQKPALADPIEQTALYKDGIQLTYGAGGDQVVFDESTGLVTFNTAPGASVLHWVGDFDVPVRLDSDRMRTETLNKNNRFLIKGWLGIPIVEIKL